MSDEWRAYNNLETKYKRGVVTHSKRQYVDGVFTQTQLRCLVKFVKILLQMFRRWPYVFRLSACADVDQAPSIEFCVKITINILPLTMGTTPLLYFVSKML